MKLTRYAIVLYALSSLPCLLTGQNIIHYDGQLKKQHYRLTSLFKCTARNVEEILDKK